MSGFLQRIAAGAARPERNLHPQVGAMFEVARREEIAGRATPLEGLTLADGAERSAKASLTDLRRGDLPGDKAQVEPAPLQESSVDRMIPHCQREDRVPVERDPTAHVLVGREPILHGENRKKEESSVEDGKRPQVLSERSASGEEATREAGTKKISNTEPLVVQRLLMREMAKKDASAGNVGAAEPEPRAQRGAFPGRAPKWQNEERTQSTQRAESAMQDIQIHIGRIEVIAVPPPAPRAAAASPRRTMSLDDYLKQRNGHAR